jgi:cytochrome o ubiquinol oxidase subunit II
MRKKYIILLAFWSVVALISLGLVFYYSDDIAMLNPKGLIALKERDLMLIATVLMLIVVIPVFILTIAIAWEYRASNKNAEYTPDWDYNLTAESIWWGFPLVIVIILSFVAWESSHELDPFKPIQSSTKPLRIQVVALQWKWLFIYPEQDIATINFIQIPEKTPINFEITADAPMNSFWIPELGGQIYAMPGMETKLHLIADDIGSFRGSSANISGEGFASMTFDVKSSSQEDFDQWVQSVKQSSANLAQNEYLKIAKPSSYDPVATFILGQKDLFKWIVMRPMMNTRQTHGQEMEEKNKQPEQAEKS